MPQERGPLNLMTSGMLDGLGDIAEMRRTYTAIETSFSEPGARTIVVSSADMSEGKTVTVAGLAAVAVRNSERRVLAVDFNWYRPGLHTVFGLDQSFDIRELASTVVITDLVQKSRIDRLDVLVAPLSRSAGAGTGANLNLLAENIIRQARVSYDVTLIDTSPLYPVNRRMVDPAVFSKTADGLVLVVLARETHRKRVKRALITLQTAGANVLGVVANRW